jgi:transposase InsO family protein
LGHWQPDEARSGDLHTGYGSGIATTTEGCIHHTDRGSQYCSNEYQKRLSKHGLKVSMNGKRNCYDHSMVETFFKSIKAELIWRNLWDRRL